MLDTVIAEPVSIRQGIRPRIPMALVGIAPFVTYVGVFLLLPTGIMVYGAFHGQRGLSLDAIRSLVHGDVIRAFVNSFEVSAESAVIGAVVGSVAAYLISTGNPAGVLRRVTTALSGVLAQFSGVTLAFAFIATIGSQGLITLALAHLGLDLDPNGVWLYQLKGLAIVYSYYQVPLMVLVFLPSLDAIRPQWREAAESLGCTTFAYWRYIAGPLLAPAFLSAFLLLFVNAFSGYATAAALISQGGLIVPLKISNDLYSEVAFGGSNSASAMALGMVLVVAVVMALTAILQRRTARWLH